MTRYVIIGDGGAGTTAAHFIRRADPTGQIEIYSDDPNAAYYRAALTNYLIGELRETQLFATPPDFYKTNNIQRQLGRVSAVDVKNSRLNLAQGSDVPYDQLLIAAGASPNPPSFPGAELPGVMTMRTLQDARTVMDMASSKRLHQAVVVGGGPLGIEWVQALIHHHAKVVYLLRGDMFFGQALDRTASDLVISRLRAEGVDVRINEEIGEAVSGKDGRLRAVRLKASGDLIECQLVGAAIGIKPNVDFLEGSDIDIAVDPKRGTPQGIKVNEYMRTNVSNVYAAGDILYRTLGLWEGARLQGRVSGRNMAGGSEIYHQSTHYNATRLYDLDFAGVGEVAEKPGDQVLIDFPKGSGRVAYRKLIIRGDKLIGAIMLGQRKEHIRKYGLQYRKLIDRGADVSAVSKNLLDASFDLASWMDSQDMGDQIDEARRIKVQPMAPSIADMRQTRHSLNADFFNQPKETPKVIDATLQRGDLSIPLKSTTRIGRKPENDLVLSDPDVSGEHAQIRWDDSAFVLEDLQSRNGTFLNDVRIIAASPLVDGALVRVGGVQLRFVLSDSDEKLRLSSAGLPEAPRQPLAQPSDPTWGTLQIGEKQIALREISLNIGRDVRADIVLDDTTVSYLHAQIVRQGTDSYLRDLGSRNGTYVNGGLVSVPHSLQNGDVIKLGEAWLVFHTGPAASAGQQQPISVSPSTAPSPLPVPVGEVKADTPILRSLIVRAGPMLGLSFELITSPVKIGRDPASQIVLNDQTWSWHHASLKKEGEHWSVIDLGSSNGTWLNDEKLEPNRVYPLQTADRLRLGDTLLEVTEHAT